MAGEGLWWSQKSCHTHLQKHQGRQSKELQTAPSHLRPWEDCGENPPRSHFQEHEVFWCNQLVFTRANHAWSTCCLLWWDDWLCGWGDNDGCGLPGLLTKPSAQLCHIGELKEQRSATEGLIGHQILAAFFRSQYWSWYFFRDLNDGVGHAPQKSSQMLPNWGKWLVVRAAVQKWTDRNHVKFWKVKISCICEGKATRNSRGWALPHCGAVLQKRT